MLQNQRLFAMQQMMNGMRQNATQGVVPAVKKAEDVNASESRMQPAAKPATKPAAKPATKPAAKPATKPVAKPATKKPVSSSDGESDESNESNESNESESSGISTVSSKSVVSIHPNLNKIMSDRKKMKTVDSANLSSTDNSSDSPHSSAKRPIVLNIDTLTKAKVALPAKPAAKSKPTVSKPVKSVESFEEDISFEAISFGKKSNISGGSSDGASRRGRPRKNMQIRLT
jgi:hypothetical protein